MKVGAKVVDTFGAKTYLIEEALGQGGFGQAYRAEHLTPAGRRRPNGKGCVCLKVTLDPEAWHGESYFGLLTKGLPNVVQHIGSFPVKTRSGMRYFLVLELERGGTVADWVASGKGAWTTGQVRNAMRPLGRVVEAMHSSGAMHRDIKPANVYVGGRRSLRLGDFGIARHGLGGRGPRADVMAPAFVATSLLDGRKEWLPSDDVYQLGLLGLTLLIGETTFDPDWRSLRHRLPESSLRETLQRATGPRSNRYLSAAEFVAALQETTD
jgi:serine/threonine protein kinase